MKTVSIDDAVEALDAMDDFARMEIGVDAHGPRGVLERFIAETEALRKDAERFRWLMRSNIDAGAFVFSWKNEGRDPFTSIRASGTTNVAGLFDDTGEAIDAAIKEANHG